VVSSLRAVLKIPLNCPLAKVFRNYRGVALSGGFAGFFKIFLIRSSTLSCKMIFEEDNLRSIFYKMLYAETKSFIAQVLTPVFN
jgi:hypothetical protein